MHRGYKWQVSCEVLILREKKRNSVLQYRRTMPRCVLSPVNFAYHKTAQSSKEDIFGKLHRVFYNHKITFLIFDTLTSQ